MTQASDLPKLALSRLEAIGNGNGILPSEIALVSANAADYEIKGVSTIQLKTATRGARKNSAAETGGGIVTCRNFVELAAAVAAAAAQLPKDWMGSVEAVLKSKSKPLWGYEGEFALPELARTFTATEACKSCQGQSRIPCSTCYGKGVTPCNFCHQQRRITCRTCHGAGKNPQDAQQPCPVCHGQQTEPCPQCNERGNVKCYACNGVSSVACNDCRGSGRLSETVTLDYVATISFGLSAEQSLPSPLLQAIDRGGLASLARGHASIATDEPEGEGAAVRIHQRATLPFAEAKFRIAGQAVAAQILGHKAAILGMPPFLDKVLADGMNALRASAMGGGDLTGVLRHRALREGLLMNLREPAKADDPANFIRLYPVGLSRGCADDILRLSKRVLVTATRRVRWGVSVGTLLFCAAIFWLYYQGPLRPMLRNLLPGKSIDYFDFFLLGGGLAALWFAVQEAQGWVLRRKFALSRSEPLPKQNLGRSLWVFGGILCVIWALTMFFGLHAPDWAKMIRIEYAAGILFG